MRLYIYSKFFVDSEGQAKAFREGKCESIVNIPAVIHKVASIMLFGWYKYTQFLNVWILESSEILVSSGRS